MVGNGAAMGVHQATAPNVCWAMDFQFDQTANTRPLKILNIPDEYSRECLASFVARSITAADVTAVLDDLLSVRGRRIYLRCDNGPEFIANVVAHWSREVGTTLWFIEPGSPWLNGRVESFNGRLRDEMLNGELFESVKEAQVLLDHWRTQYNTYRRDRTVLLDILLLNNKGSFDSRANPVGGCDFRSRSRPKRQREAIGPLGRSSQFVS